MKIAIHNSNNGFHPLWVDYCIKNNIPYKIVDCYANDIISQLEDCKALMWHFSHISGRDNLIAKQILFALEHSGFKTFPDFRTSWHFDDKMAQKYLFEAMAIKTVDTYVFVNKKDAINWAETTTFPKVFKLRSGASSRNVKLVKSKAQAKKLINKAFGYGFKQYDKWGNLKDRFTKYKSGIVPFSTVVKGVYRLFKAPEYSNSISREKNYVYFQDFVANQDSDLRIIVIDNKAFAIKRMVRKGDFRASGSGKIYFKKSLFDIKVIKEAFSASKKIKSQSLVLDYVLNNENEPILIEVSYGFFTPPYENCPGYWDSDLNWHEGSFDPYGWMIDGVIK